MTKTEVLHYAPTDSDFCSGEGGYQILARVTYWFGKRIRVKEIDREDVPQIADEIERITNGSSCELNSLIAQLRGDK